MPSCISICAQIGNYTLSNEKKTKTAPDLLKNNEERRQGVIPLPTVSDANDYEIKKYPKTRDDEEIIRQAIENNEFLSKMLKGALLNETIEAMYAKEVSAKEIVIKEGDKGSHMYVSAGGKFKITVQGKLFEEFEDNRVFGELAILYNDKRRATIKALTNGKIWVLDRTTFRKLTIGFSIKEEEERFEFLKNVPNLNKVSEEILHKVTYLLKTEFFPTDTQIIREGDRGYKFYIISAGSVKILKEGDGVVGNCTRGQYFGELALLKEDCRQATVIAEAPGVECLTLTLQEFIDHFGELGQEDLDSKNVLKKISGKDKVNYEYDDIKLNDFAVIKTLGVGGFGRVELVQHKVREDLIFALKYLKKIDMVEQNQQDHVCNEKMIQMACNSDFIVKLYRSYKNRKYIYFLMEPCLGGDLWTSLQRQNKSHKLDEKDARFTTACVIEAFSYLHERGIVYRDLKPENIMIDSVGYIKLTDFGFAKILGPRDRTYTFAGTPEYVAPEIILNRGHDKAVDYWTLGIFIFELLTGRTPFKTSDFNHMKTYNRILTGIEHVEFPLYITKHGRHIIQKLCKSKALDRLGCQRNGVRDLKNHKWFTGFDWEGLIQRTLQPPFKPKLKSKIDTKYFDSFKKDSDLPPDETSGWDKDF